MLDIPAGVFPSGKFGRVLILNELKNLDFHHAKSAGFVGSDVRAKPFNNFGRATAKPS